MGHNENQTHWSLIVREGWQRMLETSELPIAKVDKVYEGGFSIQEWFLNAKRISLGLAAIVAESFVGGKAETATTDTVVQRAKTVLDWKNVITALDECTVKVLGMVWFADKLSAELMYPETELLIQEKIWRLLETNLARKKTELVANVEEVIEKIDSANKNVTSWAEIIRFA
jgi:hypothetical protein